MSFTDLLPSVKELSYSDKLLLLHLLSGDLLREAGLSPLETQGKTEPQGLHDSFEAAAVLARALTEEKIATHG